MIDETDTIPNRLKRWERGETPGPWCATLFPTNQCNLHCIMCWRYYKATQGMQDRAEPDAPQTFRPNPEMEVSDDRWLEIVDECVLLGCRDFFIQGGGEPLLRAPLVMRMCERIRSHGMNGKLLTNATLLRPEHMRKLIEIGWDTLTSSIDGPTAEMHDLLRGANAFDRSVTAIAQCADLRRQMNASRPRLQLNTTLTRHNHDVLPAMVELAHRLGCDSVQAGLTCVHFGLEHLVTREQHRALPALVEQAKQRGRQLGIEVDYDHVTRNPWGSVFSRRLWAGTASVPPGMSASCCVCPWYSLAVFADGRVAQCSMNWREKAPSVRDSSLAEIWLGPYFAKLRQRTADATPAECCHVCPSILDAHSPSLRVMDDAYLNGTVFQ